MKRIAVIGAGASGLNRVEHSGNPGDMTRNRRYRTDVFRRFPSLALALTVNHLNSKIDYKRYGLKPKYGPTSAHPTVNDELPNRIISGGVIIKDNVKEFTETNAVFVDGTKVDNIDAVVLATGYLFGFPFIDESVLTVKDNRVNLYKYMFPPDLEKRTLAIIGCFQPLGAIMPVCEMQCRLATRVFKGLVKLPNKEDMWQDIREKQQAMARRYKESTRHTIQVDYIPFIDELANMIGCRPNIKAMFVKDPTLAIRCYFGPCTPYQFRLTGPGAWKGAREAILKQWERTYQPLKTRQCGEEQPTKGRGFFHVVIIVTLAVLLYFLL